MAVVPKAVFYYDTSKSNELFVTCITSTTNQKDPLPRLTREFVYEISRNEKNASLNHFLAVKGTIILFTFLLQRLALSEYLNSQYIQPSRLDGLGPIYIYE